MVGNKKNAGSWWLNRGNMWALGWPYSTKTANREADSVKQDQATSM